MVGPSYKEDGRLISGVGKGEEKIIRRKSRVYKMASWPLGSQAKALVVGQPVTGEWLR